MIVLTPELVARIDKLDLEFLRREYSAERELAILMGWVEADLSLLCHEPLIIAINTVLHRILYDGFRGYQDFTRDSLKKAFMVEFKGLRVFENWLDQVERRWNRR